MKYPYKRVIPPHQWIKERRKPVIRDAIAYFQFWDNSVFVRVPNGMIDLAEVENGR